MSVKNQLIITIICAVILPLTAVALLVSQQIRSQAVDDFEQRAIAEIQHVNTAFTIYLDSLAEDATFLARSPTILALTDETTTYMGVSPRMTRSLRSGDPEAEAFALMEDFGESRPDYAYVFLGLETGGYIQWPSTETSDYDPRLRGWYQEAIASRTQPFRPPAYQDAFSGVPLIDYLHTFTTTSGIKGVVGVDVTLGRLTEMVSSVQFGQDGFLILIEDTGTILADSRQPDNNFKSALEMHDPYPRLFRETGLMRVQLEGQDWFAMVMESSTLGWKFVGLIPSREVYATANSLNLKILTITIVLLVIFILLGLWISKIIAKPITTITKGLEEIASGEGDLTKRLIVEGNAESKQMAEAFNRFVTMINLLVTDIKKDAIEINSQAKSTHQVSNEIKSGTDQQLQAIEHLSTAFNEMVATTNEVARNCNHTASAADTSQENVNRGKTYIDHTSSAVSKLEKAILESDQAMTSLAEETKNITLILDTIRGIAEQTNLLALNAAIEAARAGDHGRGFAVVADEVRTLAARTAESTAEIDNLISNLVSRTNNVSEKLTSSREHAKSTSDATEQTLEVFAEIQNSVTSIHDMATQISAAAEEQHLVAEEINRNILEINQKSGCNSESAGQLESQSSALGSVANRLNQLVSRFKID